jgi:prepilin-type N-terminal cleavage/methylation domain-containing protein
MKHGFTLIEVLVVCLLLSALALPLFISLVPVTEGLAIARVNADAGQKVRLAAARLSREFTTISNVVAGSAQNLTYEFLDPAGVSWQRQVSWSGIAGDPLTLNGVSLSDDVGWFELRYFEEPGSTRQGAWFPEAKGLEMVLECDATGDRFTNCIAPRNLSW